jgi:hypothetical protein
MSHTEQSCTFDGHLLSKDCPCGPSVESFTLPDAPMGFEWMLLPERPGGPKTEKRFRAPGETGHYSDLDPEPIQIHEAWGLDFFEGNVLKYLARYKKKNGLEDLQKVAFYAERLIQREVREGCS